MKSRLGDPYPISIVGGKHKPRIIDHDASTKARNPSAISRKGRRVRFARLVKVAKSGGGSDEDEVHELRDNNKERDPDSHALQSLLTILKDKRPGSSISSLVNSTTIDLICQLFSRDDYASFAAQLTDVSDAKNLLDFIFHLPRSRRLIKNLGGAVDIKRRARRFMLKVITKTPVIPESLTVTGVRTAEHDHIGRGGFGYVFKGKLQGNTVALKVLYKVDNNAAFCREALMWGSLCHKFVLPLLGIYEDKSAKQLFLVSPYMKNGTLAQWRKSANPSVTEVDKRILEVAKGIEYIHSEGVVHGDLRGDNILLDADLHVKIADFGLTRLSEATNTKSGALHVNFAAPELFGYCEDDESEDDDAPIRTQKSDVYAFGCLYYEIHYDAIPFANKNGMQIMALLARGLHPPRQNEPPLSDGTWELIRSCWAREASNRPIIEAIAENMVAIAQSAAPGDPSYEASLRGLQSPLAVEQMRHASARPPSFFANPPPHFAYAIHPSSIHSNKLASNDRTLPTNPESVAYYGQKWSWRPRVWDPEMPLQNIPVKFNSPWLPAWLTWKDDVLSGIPPPGATDCTITVNAIYVLDGQEDQMSHTFTITMVSVSVAEAASRARRRPSVADGSSRKRSTRDTSLRQRSKARSKMTSSSTSGYAGIMAAPASTTTPDVDSGVITESPDKRVLRVLQQAAQNVITEANSLIITGTPEIQETVEDLAKQTYVLEQALDAYERELSGQGNPQTRRLTLAAQHVVVQAGHIVIADKTGGIFVAQSDVAAIESVSVGELSNATQVAIAAAIKKGTATDVNGIIITAASILKDWEPYPRY